MRPCRSTLVISEITRPAPELASIPRWVMCQSEATPSLALYWHIGETTTRFASSRPASRIGENRALVMSLAMSEDNEGSRWNHSGRRGARASDPAVVKSGRWALPTRDLRRELTRALRRELRLRGSSRLGFAHDRDRKLLHPLCRRRGLAQALLKIRVVVVDFPVAAVIQVRIGQTPAFREVTPFPGDSSEFSETFQMSHDRN